jgi:hypothetical protein
MSILSNPPNVNPSDRFPSHWESPGIKNQHISAYVHLAFFRTLCLLSVGYKTLEHTHGISAAGDKEWDESRARLQLRLGNTTVVVRIFRLITW